MHRRALGHSARPLSIAVAGLLALALGCSDNGALAPKTPSEPLPPGTPGTWQDLGLSTGFVEVLALTTWNGHLFAGGSFHGVNGAPSTSLAEWDGTTWSDVGSDFGGGVTALTVYDSHLVVGGNFLHIAGDPIQYLAEWDGATWRGLGEPPNRSITSFATYNGDLIAGGEFDSIGGVPAAFVARWDGAAWHALGGGLDGIPRALAVYHGSLIAGGSFVKAEGALAPGIAAWNGSSWSSIGGGMGGGPAGNPFGTVIALGVHGDSLIVGGSFTSAGGLPARNVARWTGTQWDSLAGGLGTVSWEFVDAFAEYGDTLVAAGNFPGYVRRWNGNAWAPMSALNGTVNALTVYDGWLIAGGYFPKEAGFYANGIARWVK